MISLQAQINWFSKVLQTTMQLYFQQDCPVSSIYEIALPENNNLQEVCGCPLTFDEQVIVMLALMPHLSPQVLDIFFVNNKNFDRPFTEFGGWKGLSHGGFLPTGETAAFILAGREVEKRREVMGWFDKEHWFYRENILKLEGQGEGEPLLSGRLRVSEEVLSRLFGKTEYKPDYSIHFPAKRMSTELDWEDLVVEYEVASELEKLHLWMVHHRKIMEDWGLKRFLKRGYRALFYGPPGTGKTLAATLLGKCNNREVYRVDLSMIVSKYIGETEKNLGRLFDSAENHNWILFFDEADALFGKRVSASTSNDRHANQEVAYLLQRVEDFPGIVILATNLRSNIDEAFFRRFQSQVYFPMPDEAARELLWKKMLPAAWIRDTALLRQAVEAPLSGGTISNVIRRCALHMVAAGEEYLTAEALREALQKELYHEGRF